MGQRINIDNDWKFFLGDLSPQSPTDSWGGAKAGSYNFGVPAKDFDDSKWRTVDVPHDFVSEGDYTQKRTDSGDMQKIPEMESIDSRHLAGGSLEGGIAWYRKRFTLPQCSGKRVYIFFDGIYRNSTVYLNEYLIGTHTSGYTSFYYDITDFVNQEGENILAVRVDATGREGWWYEGGGIYRHVWLEVKDNVSIAPWGVFAASAVNLDTNSADVTIKTEIESKLLEDENVTVESIITDAEGNQVLKTDSEITVSAWDNCICEQKVSMDNVNLWSLENPYLYKLMTNIYVNGALTDSTETNFGIREIRFDSDKGLFLNGKNIKVTGLCCHHDHAGVGIGIPDSVYEYRMAQLKSMGTNGYRCAHHPPTRELLDICDRIGMLVMDETRRMSSCNEDIENLCSMVKRDRNHPSIFIWGIGNEEVFSQDRVETARTTVTMKMEIRKLDGTRPITSAVVCWNGKERFDNAAKYVDVTKNLDVMGFNYCRTAWDDYHERMPHQPMIITEASSNSSTRGCYSTNEANGHYYVLDKNNFDKVKNGTKAVKMDVAESEWKYFAERDYLSGIFLWTGIDYRGEPTPLSYPAVYSQFGIFDYCAFPKDNYYYYKSWWTDEDVLHIFPHWNFIGMEGKKITMHCYSNLDEVELFVNGKSYGRKAMERNWYLTWEDVVYEEGEVSAVGYRNGEKAVCKSVKTTDAPYEIKLSPYKSEVNCGDTVIVNVSVVDKNGAVVPTADNKICFEAEGGKFLGTGNGNPGDHAPDKVPVRRVFNGLGQLLVRADEAGTIKVTAKSDGLYQAVCEVKIK